MLQIQNDTPFETGRAVQIDAQGNHVWVVVVKGTYQITGEPELRFADEQEKVCLLPEYLGEPGKSTCRRETELVFDHPGTSVFILGHAWSPNGQPVKALDVHAQMGPIQKAVRVFGDRYWLPSKNTLVASEPREFTTVPLLFERAFGGTIRAADGQPTATFDDNPIGAGFAAQMQDLVHKPLPNLEYPHDPTRDWQSQPKPASFAVVPPNWTPRRTFAGTFDDRWREERMPIWPEDFDSRFFLAAPADQVSTVPLRRGDYVVLRNLSRHGDISFFLPQVHLSFFTEHKSSDVRHAAHLDRVYVEPDALKVVLVWRTTVNCGPDARVIRQTSIDTKRVLR